MPNHITNVDGIQLAVVNAFGDIVNPNTWHGISGHRDEKNPVFFCTAGHPYKGYGKLTQAGQDDLALTVRPCYSMPDTDMAFYFKSNDELNMRHLCYTVTRPITQTVTWTTKEDTDLGITPSTQEAFQ